MCNTGDPVAQRIHRENVERILLASFVAGLTGAPGKQVMYASPRDIQQALSIALSVQEAEKQNDLARVSTRDSIIQPVC